MKLTSTITLFSLLLLSSIDVSAVQKEVTSDSLRALIGLEKDPDKKISLHLRRAGRLHLKYNADSTLYHNLEARKLFSQVKDSTLYLMKLHGNYVLAYGFRGDFKKALKSIKDIEPVLKVERERKYESEKAKEEHAEKLFRTLNAVGDIYRKIGDYEKSYSYFIDATYVAETMQEKKHMADGFNNLGMLYNEQGDDAKAKTFYLRAIDLNKKAVETGGEEHDLYKLGTNYNNIGNSYKNLEKFDSAEMAYKAAMDIMIEMKIKYGEAVILDNLGNLFLKKGDHPQALKHRRKALKIQQGIGSTDQQSILLAGISEILIELKNWSDAEKNALEAFELAQANDQPMNVRTASQLLVQIYDSIENTANAYKYLLIFKEKDDLLSSEAKERAIENLKIGFETERNETENQLLKQKSIVDQSLIEKQKLYLYVFVIAIIFVTVVSILIFRLYRSTARQKLLIQEQTSKLQALDSFKSRFFANVSHDLRTPLTLIQGHIFQLRNEDNYLNTKSEQSLDKLERNAHKLIRLTDEIKDLIQLENDKLKISYQSIAINTYLRRLINLFSSAAELKKIDLQFQTDIKEELIVHLDPSLFEKIIYNLVANALRFTSLNGHINVSLSCVENSVEISIADDGAGIPQEKVEYIFERFYQGDNEANSRSEGIGIGLALVLELVKLHEGSIRVESKVGNGTKFTVTLPLNLDKKVVEGKKGDNYVEQNRKLLTEEETISEGLIDLTEEDKRSKDAKMALIVDDHPDIRHHIQELIQDKYIIRQAGNGREALEVLSREKIDIVITDLMMPWMDGHELIDEMKENESLSKVPVLVVSARTTEEDKLKVLEHGINDFLAKPFHPDDLKLRIDNLIANGSSAEIWDEIASDRKKLSDIEKNVLSKLNSLILSRIDDPLLAVKDLADELVTSSRSAFTIISEMTGMSPKDFIDEVRIRYSEDLLKKKKVRSVTEAAQAVGMSNTTHFSRKFKKKTGKHPSELLS